MNLQQNAVIQWQPEALEEILYLANIPSSIKHKSGIKKIIQHVASELDVLGFEKIDYLRSLNKNFASTLIAESKPLASQKIILVCHADTVVSPDSNQDFIIDKDILQGPGVADNKGGILVMLNALRQLDLQDMDLNIVVVVSANEELGSPGFNTYLKKIGQDASAVFGFEPSLPNGDIIIQRNGNYWLEVIAIGIEAHSGRCKGEELNIAHDFILKFHEVLMLNKKYPSVRTNVGSLCSSKDVFNIVCGDLKAKIDFRYSIEEEFQKYLSEVKQIFMGPRLINCDGNAGALQFIVHDHCPPLEKNLRAESVLSNYQDYVQMAEKRRPNLSFSGGASDTNYLSNPKSFCVDGLGPIGGRLHRMDEYVVISSLTTRANAFANFLKHIGEKNGFRFF